MSKNTVSNDTISDFELYHIYRRMYDSKDIDKSWFIRGSQPWIRMHQIKDRIVNKISFKRENK